MATTINDAFSAIDDYMAKNGKGQNYLAKKFIDLFEGADSPLNVKNGAMVAVVDKFKKLGKSIDNFDTTVNSMGMKVRIMMAALKPTSFRLLNDSADRLSKKMDSYGKALKLPRLSSSVARINNPFPKKIENHLSNIDKNISRIEHTTGFTKFIISTMATMMAASSREKVLPPSSNNNYTKSPRSIQLFSNNNSSNYSPNESTKKGFFGKLFSGIWSITKIVGGIYLLGKLKQYLDDTSTGRSIKALIKSMFTTVLGKITSIVTSKELWKTLGNSVLLLVDVAGSIADNIFKYVIEPISTKVKQVDWGKAVEYMGNKMKWIYSNILEPIITSISNSIKKDLDNGDWGSLTTKMLGTVGVLSLGFGGLLGSFTSLAGIVGVPGVAVGAGLIAASTLLFNRMNALADMWNESSKLAHDQGLKLQNGAYMMTNNIKEYERKLKVIEDAIAGTPDGPVKDALLTERIRNISLSETEKARQRFGMAEGKLLDLQNRSILDRFNISSIKSAAAIEYEYSVAKYKYNDLLKKSQAPRPDVKKVQDAEIIIPDKKDSHLFAKGGGPFDVALKDVNKKVDMIISVLSDGFSGLAQITAQSGGAVAQAVVASAGASKTAPATVIGGVNPIQRHRINTGRHIEFVQ